MILTRLPVQTDFSILWWIGVMETLTRAFFLAPKRYFSILWWIGVMETDARNTATAVGREFQYPLVDWGDGDPMSALLPLPLGEFQYPLVDWGDGDPSESAFCDKNTGISVSSGGLG